MRLWRLKALGLREEQSRFIANWFRNTSRADHKGFTFWPARLLVQTCLSVGSSGPGGRQSTAARNAKIKVNEVTKKAKEMAAQQELQRKVTERELKRSRREMACVKKKAEKQRKNAEKKINKVKRDSEKEVRALEGSGSGSTRRRPTRLRRKSGRRRRRRSCCSWRSTSK